MLAIRSLPELDDVAPQVIERHSAGRSMAPEPNEWHLAVSRIEDLLDRDDDFILVPQNIPVRPPGLEHLVAPLV